LTASIASLGVVNPPVVFETESGLTVISGFKRLNSCRQLGMEDVPVRILPPDTPLIQLIRTAITDNALQRPLNLLELSRAFHLLYKHMADYNQVTKEAASLGLPDNPSYIRKIVPLCRFLQAIQDGIISDAIPLATAIHLARMPASMANRFAELFNTLAVSLGKQREIIQMTEEIAAREDLEIDRVLEDAWRQSRGVEGERDRAQVVRDLRRYLKQRRFPHYASADMARNDLIRRLRLGPGLTLKPPPAFEGNIYTFNISFHTLAELERHITTLKRIAASPDFQMLINS